MGARILDWAIVALLVAVMAWPAWTGSQLGLFFNEVLRHVR